jgi:hypothetical protein
MDVRNIKLRWKLAAAGFVTVIILGLVTLRYGGQLAAPFLERGSSRDTTVGTAPITDSTAVVLASSDTNSTITRYGPFVIDGRSYRFEVQRDTGAEKPRGAARRVQAFDSAGHVVYDENLFLRRDSTGMEDWLEFAPTLIEDASGIARGFKFTYAWFPSPPISGVAFSLVAPRGDSLIVLTPTTIGYYGSATPLPAGSVFGSSRLMPNNQLAIESGRGWFNALINLRVDFWCVPKTDGCVRIDLKDSVAGLARFGVTTWQREKVGTTTVEAYNAPHGNLERITIPVGEEAEILGGAARVFFERTPGLFLSAEDEWLEIRVNGRRVWVTGEEAFRALGLQQVG